MKTKLIVLLLLGLMSCSKSKSVDPASACNEYLQKYSSDLTKFGSEQTPANCQAVVNSLNQILNKCTILSEADRKTYQANLKDIKCD